MLNGLIDFSSSIKFLESAGRIFDHRIIWEISRRYMSVVFYGVQQGLLHKLLKNLTACCLGYIYRWEKEYLWQQSQFKLEV